MNVDKKRKGLIIILLDNYKHEKIVKWAES